MYHHMDIATSIHFTPIFLPFHRVFMVAYERALQTCDERFKSVQMTYWDIALDSHAPARAIVFRPEYFGGNGDSGHDWCVRDGFFAGRLAVHPRDKCLKRNFDLDQFVVKGNAEAEIGAMYSNSLLQMAQQTGQPRKYDYFRNVLESTIHEGFYHLTPAVHFGVGGARGDMSKADTAPNDPIFWFRFFNPGYITQTLIVSGLNGRLPFLTWLMLTTVTTSTVILYLSMIL